MCSRPAHSRKIDAVRERYERKEKKGKEKSRKAAAVKSVLSCM
jgi:hypothetical protein